MVQISIKQRPFCDPSGEVAMPEVMSRVVDVFRGLVVVDVLQAEERGRVEDVPGREQFLRYIPVVILIGAEKQISTAFQVTFTRGRSSLTAEAPVGAVAVDECDIVTD
jgi:hypothetical protein